MNEPKQHSVLVVDDEPNVINAIRRELNTQPFGRYRYRIEGICDPRQALERARAEPFEVVISDFRMPDMDGLEFLKQLAQIQPDCTRIVLSGQTDMESLIRMINETHIYRFIPKPWSNYFLKSSLAQAIDMREMNLRNRDLANTLRQHGIELPADALNRTDQILVVDDDVAVANAVARDLTHHSRLDGVFAAMRSEMTAIPAAELDTARISVQVTQSPAHALRMADDVTFSCVISDYQMPGMDGAKLLAEFSEKQPDAALIMLSGAANLDSIVYALDMAHIHNFIAKPWDGFALRAAVAQALARRRLLLENRVLANLCKARDLGITGD
jgi:DNA-binding NtrC family response regulator